MARFLSILFWVAVVSVGLPVMMLVGSFAVSTFSGGGQHRIPATQVDLAGLTPSPLVPRGELADIFNLFSRYTDLQREETEREIKGKVVQWRLPVYEVSSSGSRRYLIQTTSGSGLVGTLCRVTARNEEDERFIRSLKTGDFVVCKGIISGVSLRSIEISPAILLR